MCRTGRYSFVLKLQTIGDTSEETVSITILTPLNIQADLVCNDSELEYTPAAENMQGLKRINLRRLLPLTFPPALFRREG